MKIDLTDRRIVRAVFWLYAAGWTLLLLVPDPVKMLGVRDVLPEEIASGHGHWDKLVHGTGYLVLMVTLGFAYDFARRTPPSGVSVRWLFLACLVHGASTEVLQWASGWRTGDFVDWLADAAGTTLGMLVLRSFQRRFARARRQGEG